MNEELMKLIHEKHKSIRNIRRMEKRIQVQIPCMYPESEISWIDIFQAPFSVEKIVTKWLCMGGEVC
jgi:hypothetical protein